MYTVVAYENASPVNLHPIHPNGVFLVIDFPGSPGHFSDNLCRDF